MDTAPDSSGVDPECSEVNKPPDNSGVDTTPEGSGTCSALLIRTVCYLISLNLCFIALVLSILTDTAHNTKKQGCGSGSGSGIIILDPDLTNIKTTFYKHKKMLF